MKETKDVHETESNKSLRTMETSDTTKLMETKLEVAETRDAVVGKAVAIGVESAAEEPEAAVDVQELTELATDRLQSIIVELNEVVATVGAAKNSRGDAKFAEMKSIETEDAGGPRTVVVEVVEEPTAVCFDFNNEETVVATAETEATDEATTVSDDADAAAKLEPTKVVVVNVSGSSAAEKEGASNEGLAVVATDEKPADERSFVDICDEIASVVKSDAITVVAEEGKTETTTWEAIESEHVDEAEPVILDMDVSVGGIAIEPTVEEVVVEAVADFETDDEAIPTELKVSIEGDSAIVADDVTDGEAARVDEGGEEAIAVQEQEVAGKEAEAFDSEAFDIEVETSVTTETIRDDDTSTNTIVGTIVKEVEAEEVFVVTNDEGVRTETETAPIDEDTDVDVKKTESDTASFDKGTDVVVSAVETVAAAPSAKIDEATVDEIKPSFDTKIAAVAVEEADTETVPVTEMNEVQLEKSKSVEATAVKNDFATEKVKESEQFIANMPAVATVQTASAISKVSDDEVAPTTQTPVSTVATADSKSVKVNLTVSTVNEYQENERSKANDNFEMDTKPISAVSTLIGRFEHIAKRNAIEAASSRTSSRTSSRVSSPLSSPPSTLSRGTSSDTVGKSNKAIENSESPVYVESNHENGLTEAEANQKISEVEKVATVAESVDASSGFEETLAEYDVCESATTLNEAVAIEESLAATDVDEAAKENVVAEATFVAVDAEVEVEAFNEKSDAMEEAPVAEVGMFERESIDEFTEAEVEVEKALAVEVELAEIMAEPEAEDVDLASSTKDEISGIADGADAIALELTETDKTVEEVPIDMAEADVEASEPQTILAAYKPAEASILSIDVPEVDAAWNEAVGDVQEDAEDAAPSASSSSLVDVEEAVAIADFTTDTLDNFVPVTKQIEEDSSDLVLAMKETQAMYEKLPESQVEGGKQEESLQSMEREEPLTSPPAPRVQTGDGALAYKVTTKASVVTAPPKEATKAVHDDAVRTEGTPERNSMQIPYEQLTYEILGVTRASNVIMYHIYTINHATGEQAMSSIPKRYSEFKLLDEQLRALDLPSARGLPVLPKPGVISFLRGRRSQKTIELREKAFGDFLHYVRDHEDLHKSSVFQQFLAT